jgi:hypothetical protein
VVECTALEMRHRCKPIGGSNPSLSARSVYQQISVNLRTIKKSLSVIGFCDLGNSCNLSPYPQMSVVVVP